MNCARLQDLSVMRNQLIHRGGHLPNDDRRTKRISNITGIGLAGSPMIIEDEFVRDVFDSAKVYLCAAAKA